MMTASVVENIQNTQLAMVNIKRSGGAQAGRAGCGSGEAV